MPVGETVRGLIVPIRNMMATVRRRRSRSRAHNRRRSYVAAGHRGPWSTNRFLIYIVPVTGSLAWRPVGLVVLADAGLLTATLNQYGSPRDELYFRMLASHPAWGYVDQPPLTPMLAKAGIAVFG